MDDKFLRDKINDDNIEIPESLLPENISKLLEKSEEKVNGLAGESDIDGRAKGTNENIVNIKGINEKTVNESDKKNREKRQMIKYLRSCALAAAALIVVLTGASMMGRLRENKYTAAGQNGNPVPGTDMPETMEETFVCGTTQAAGDTDMNKTKYDELYDKLVRGNAYNITTDGGYYITDDVQAADGESSTQADGIYNETTAENGRWYASTKDPDASDDEGTKDEETGDNFSGNNDQEEGVSEGNIFKTEQSVIRTIDAFEDGAWVQMVDPSVQELNKVSEAYDIEVSDLATALDEEESSRISLEDGYTLILVDIPSPEVRHEKKMYTTIPLGILIKQNAIITICKEDTPVLQYFIRNKVREFSTKKKMRFIYQLLLRSAALYQAYLRGIDKKRIEIEERIDGDTQDVDIIELHELESTLVYFATSLRSNSIVLERLRRYKRLEQYPEDMELLEDVMVEYQQAIEMTAIYRDIIDGTRELLSSVVDNRLNNVMKYLTSITIVMAIPTIISGIYGMNVSGVGMPLASSPYGFGIICVLILLICVAALWILKRKKML